MIKDNFVNEFGEENLEGTHLVWIYISPGTDKVEGIAPNWSSSIFMLYKLKPENTNYNISENILLSNLRRSLKIATYKSLGKNNVQRQFARSLSHEYKNLNQDIAVLSEQLLSDLKEIRPGRLKKEIKNVEYRIQALYYLSQETTAISKATSWMAHPTKNNINFRNENAGEIFQQIVFLAINLIGYTRNNWNLINIPSIEDNRKNICVYLGLKERTSLTTLFSYLYVQVMIFFAFEPVRNIRSDLPSDQIEITTILDGNKLEIHQILLVNEEDELDSMRSSSVQRLMHLLNNSEGGVKPFIFITPNVTSKTLEQVDERFRVKRITTIMVNSIPFPK